MTWMPQEGPASIYGYDGRIHPERATPLEWRKFWMVKARQRGTHTRQQWIDLRDKIGRCVSCGSTAAVLTKDHIFPVSRGGCDCIENIQPMCQPCNSSKCDRLEFAL